MAHIVTNRGVATIVGAAITGSTDVRAGVITTAVLPSDAAIRDMNFVSELLTSGTGASTEAAASGYSRQDLANVTVTESDGSDVVTVVSDDALISSVAAGETWGAIFYFIEAGADTSRILLSVDKVTTPVPTNGGDITVSGLDLTVGQDTVIGT